MLTPQEVREKGFSRAFFGGYDMVEVDDFLEVLTEDYAALYKENALLKGKLKLLADKVEEYRNTEDGMRATILSAQKMADQIIEDAKKKSETILSGADLHVQEKVSALSQEVSAEEFRLSKAKKETAEFLETVRRIYSKQLALLDGIPSLEFFQANDGQEGDPVGNAAKEIESSMQQIISAVPSADNEVDSGHDNDAAPEGPKDGSNSNESFPIRKKATMDTEIFSVSLDISDIIEDDEDDDEESRPKFDFDDLQFGKDFEIK